MLLVAMLVWLVVGTLVGLTIGPMLNDNGKHYPPA